MFSGLIKNPNYVPKCPELNMMQPGLGHQPKSRLRAPVTSHGARKHGTLLVLVQYARKVEVVLCLICR